MAEIVNARSKKGGMPPGSIVFVGEKKCEKARITIMDYDLEKLEEKEAKKVEECFEFKEKPSVSWINVSCVHETDVIEKIGKQFGVHPLILEDIVNTKQRPKIEDMGDYAYIVFRVLSFDEKNNRILSEQISIILAQNFLISFQETPNDPFDPVRQRIREGKGRLRKLGTDYLAYALIDATVDNYFLILEKLGEKIERLEEKIVVNPKPETLKAVHSLKREMIYLRKSVWPLREVISGMNRSESTLISRETGIYLRDVYDHTIQVIDTIETFRDMLSGMVDVYLSSVSNKLNEIMKVLTIIATIFIPLTFVTGIYGMNFRFMPELESPVGYYIILFVMACIGIAMLFYFRKKKWI
ncbi:MAG: magnesium/cobalt transporter CorA [Candidatus Diapherotrites archaeon]